jgi:hypothetical protein
MPRPYTLRDLEGAAAQAGIALRYLSHAMSELPPRSPD